MPGGINTKLKCTSCDYSTWDIDADGCRDDEYRRYYQDTYFCSKCHHPHQHRVYLYEDEPNLVCKHCGSTDLVLRSPFKPDLPCPKCNDGKLKVVKQFEYSC